MRLRTPLSSPFREELYFLAARCEDDCKCETMCDFFVVQKTILQHLQKSFPPELMKVSPLNSFRRVATVTRQRVEALSRTEFRRFYFGASFCFFLLRWMWDSFDTVDWSSDPL